MSDLQADERRGIRSRVRAWREGLEPGAAVASSSVVCDAVARLPESREARNILAYVAKPGSNEVDLGPLVDRWLEEGRAVSVPETSTGEIVPCRISSRRELVPARFGLLEPPADAKVIVDPGELDLVLVPGIAFDRRGHRLGFGGGYYDRFLPGTLASTIGVAHDGQLVDTLPVEPHDVPVAVLVTPSEVVRLVG